VVLASEEFEIWPVTKSCRDTRSGLADAISCRRGRKRIRSGFNESSGSSLVEY
jgi:hypothetical protein